MLSSERASTVYTTTFKTRSSKRLQLGTTFIRTIAEKIKGSCIKDFLLTLKHHLNYILHQHLLNFMEFIFSCNVARFIVCSLMKTVRIF